MNLIILDLEWNQCPSGKDREKTGNTGSFFQFVISCDYLVNKGFRINDYDPTYQNMKSFTLLIEEDTYIEMIP